MKNSNQIMYGIIFSTISSTAIAEEPRFYVGGSLAYSEDNSLNNVIDSGFASHLANSNMTEIIYENDLVFKLFAGHRINETFSIETGYVSLHKGTASSNAIIEEIGFSYNVPITLDIHASGFMFAGLASYPIHERIKVFAKLGLFAWESNSLTTKTEDVNPSYSISGSDSGTDGMFGIGARFCLKSDISIRAEYERYQLDDVDVDLYSLGLQYSF